MFDDDPKFHKSKTEHRHLVAKRRLPGYVQHLLDLLDSGLPILECDIELLYREFRAYFRSRSPFRHNAGKITAWGSPFRYCSDEKLLRYLLELDLDSAWNDKHVVHHALATMLLRARDREKRTDNKLVAEAASV